MRVPVKSFQWFGIAAALLVLAGCQALQSYSFRQYAVSVVCSYALQDGQPKWKSDENAREWVDEAIRRGLTEPDCAKLFGGAKKRHVVRLNYMLCATALQYEQLKWDTRAFAIKSVDEAKRRGLTEQDCAKTLGRSIKRQSYGIRQYAVAPLCVTALQNRQLKWDTDPNVSEWVDEAMRRGLTEQDCARALGLPKKQ
jgi:hypothetical protein